MSTVPRLVYSCTYVEQLPTSYDLCPLQCHYGQLGHLCHEAVPSKLLGNTTHDKFMTESADKEGDQCSCIAGHVRSGCTIDMATKEMMDWNVPLARKFKPVTR